MACVCVFYVFVCGVCGLSFNVVWFVVVWFVAACWLSCGVVWFVLFVCVPALCACVLLVICGVMMYGLSYFCVCVFVFACVGCVRVFSLWLNV